MRTLMTTGKRSPSQRLNNPHFLKPLSFQNQFIIIIIASIVGLPLAQKLVIPFHCPLACISLFCPSLLQVIFLTAIPRDLCRLYIMVTEAAIRCPWEAYV